MNWDDLQPVLAGVARHALTTIGGVLVTKGYLDSGAVSGFVGAGMVLVGVAWSWWQKQGQAEVADLLQKVTKKSTTAEAVKAAKAQ